MIKQAQENENVDAIADKFSAPTYTLDVAQMLRQFFPGAAVAGIGDPGGDFGKTVVSSETGVNDPGYSAGDCGGILHFANSGECSWQEYAQWAVDCCRGRMQLAGIRTMGCGLLSRGWPSAESQNSRRV